MAEPKQASVSAIRAFFRDFPLGFLMAPTLFAWAGTLAMGMGFEFGRRGRAKGPEMFPVMLAVGVILTVLILLAWIIRFMRFKAISAYPIMQLPRPRLWA